METIFPLLSGPELVLAAVIAILAGFVKGVVGFAMPLVFISGLTTFMAPELALAGLILPTLVSNTQQALRQGREAAVRSIGDFAVFLICGAIALVVAAQFVRGIPDQVMMAVIGIPVTFFAFLQLSRRQIPLAARSVRVEIGAGVVAGMLGGVSGIWGPPTVAYLTALHTPKNDQMRIQGVIYGLGAAVLLLAHIGSGVLRSETIGFSLAMVLPAFVGMRLGNAVTDRIDQTLFRQATLLVLSVIGLNLIRRAVMG